MSLNQTGKSERMEKPMSMLTDPQEKTSVELVSVCSVVPAEMYTHDGGATPMKVPRMNGRAGMSISGEARLMNQLGTNGVIRRNMM